MISKFSLLSKLTFSSRLPAEKAKLKVRMLTNGAPKS